MAAITSSTSTPVEMYAQATWEHVQEVHARGAEIEENDPVIEATLEELKVARLRGERIDATVEKIKEMAPNIAKIIGKVFGAAISSVAAGAGTIVAGPLGGAAGAGIGALAGIGLEQVAADAIPRAAEGSGVCAKTVGNTFC